MLQKFRLFVQKHENGTYTATVPGVTHVSVVDVWEDTLPATSTISAHGLLLEEVKDDVREALQKWLSKADPAELHRYGNHREGQRLEKAEVELRPSDRHGQKRKDRLKITFSLLLTRQESGQHLITVPRLLEPPLAFYCYALEELRQDAGREIGAYFKETPLEELLAYEHGRQEYLDEIEVRFTPLKPQREKKQKNDEDDPHFWALKASGANLSARAREGKLLRAYRREAEVAELLGTLAAERASSILLIGPPGVGKTALVHEAVRRIREENCPPALRKRQVWYTSGSQLLAGCCYLGQWQEKVQNVVDEVKKRRHVLHIDDVADLMDAGRSSKADDNMAQFLKPFIADGTLVLVGELTPERYRVAEARDPGFIGLFRTLNLDEPDEETTLSILGSVGGALEHALKVRVEPGAAQTALELTRRFQPYRSLPGKAVQLIQQVAADAAKSGAESRPTVTRQSTVGAFARYTGLPEFILSDHLTLDPASVARHFAERLIGQPEAVQTVVDLITVIKAGLNDPNKPLGCLFFVGPTGVGKTEMVKALAEYLFGSRDRILRFDMSEYAEPLNVGRLIGSAHGSDEGELTKGVRLQPFSVILLDEFEKAHPSIYDVMLQVLGEGRVTDGAGRTADFRSAIVLMTSNLGASPRDQRHPGLQTGDPARRLEQHYRSQVEQYFRPEFVNRLDAVVAFRPLDREAMRRIAGREMALLLQREGVKRRGLLVEIEDEVLDLLLETGFSPVYGARPLKREIERRVIVPLARYLVSHRLGESQLIQVRRDGEEVRLFSTSLTAGKETVRRAASALAPGSENGAAQKVDLKDLVEGFAALRLRLHEWADSDTVREVQNEWRKLLAQTRRKNFPNFGEKAHGVWSRIYHLERLTKRLEQLRDRAEYLEEFATLSQRERYRDYQSELGDSFTRLRREVDFLDVELLCAHLSENGQALLRLQSIGRTAMAAAGPPWVLILARMYASWAKRKGYGVRVLVPTPTYGKWLEAQGLSVKAQVAGYEEGPPVRPPWAEVAGADVDTLLRRLEEMEPSGVALALKGANVYGFLKGEQGTHKLLARGADGDPSAPFQTAVVRVDALAEAVPPGAYLLSEWEEGQKQKAAAPAKARPADVPPIARLYAPEGDRYVRDTRTDVRTTLVRDVLEGNLDDFILAYLKTEEAAGAWDGEVVRE